MSKIRELASDTAVYGLSSIVARFLNYLLVPFYTGFFAPDQYGVISLIFAAFVFLNVLFSFGMESAYIRYATDRDQAPDVFKTMQSMLIGVGSTLALLMYIGSDFVMPLISLNVNQDFTIYALLIGILWFDALSLVPYAELRLVRKSFTYAGYRVVNVIINLTLNIYLIAGLGWGIEAVLWSNLIASGVTTIGLWIITRSLFKGTFSMPVLQQVLLFGLPYVPNGLGFAINEVVDRFYLNSMNPVHIEAIYGISYSPEDITGIYNACYKLAIFMLLTVQMFRMAWQPFFMKYADATDNKTVFADVFDWFNIFAGIIFVSISMFVAEIAAIQVPFMDNGTLINIRYWEGLSIVPILLLAYWFQGWFVVFSAGIFIKEKTKILPGITFVGAVITIVLNFMLVPQFGMMGSAIATLVCYAVIAFILLYYSYKELNVLYRIQKTLIVIGITSLVVWIVQYSNLIYVDSLQVRLVMSLIGVVFVFYSLKPVRATSN